MLLNDLQEKKVWDSVYETLLFCPSTDVHVMPFAIKAPHVVFDISEMSEEAIERLDALVAEVFKQCTAVGEKIYALDWQHSAFLFDPRDAQQMQSVYVEDGRCFGGGYHAYFPEFYPDGDYYFFIDEAFRFGYLGHPWREEVWIFGQPLIDAFESVYPQLGWRVKE